MEKTKKRINFLLISLIILESSCWGKIILLVNDIPWARKFEEGIRDFEADKGTSVSFKSEAIVFRNESDWNEVCQKISTGVTVVLDFTFGNDYADSNPRKLFLEKDIPFYKIDVPTDALIKGSDAMLQSKKASNGFLIFHSDNDVDRGIHDILGNTLIRYAFLNWLTQREIIQEKFRYRIPSAVILFGKPENFREFIQNNKKDVQDRMEWVFMLNSFQSTPPLNLSELTFPYISGYYDASLCCKLQTKSTSSCDSTRCTLDLVPSEEFSKKLGYILADALSTLNPSANSINIQCTGKSSTKGKIEFNQQLETALSQKSQDIFTTSKLKDKRITLAANIKFMEIYPNETKNIGTFSLDGGFTKNQLFEFRTRKPFYRIGIVDFKPWTYFDPIENEWKGYCIKLAKGIADNMKFEYELVVSDGFGRRDDTTGRWNGLTGDLIHGKVDIAVAAYIMTSEREEFIDFVSPYYEQSGLLITMKRPDAKNSLFKFMTVLRAEVWLSIAGATVSTGLMLWFLDKFSPYSAQNNPHKYKTFRKFTLKESFWFALTSFTPQGGGEPPRAFSGRTLVAAYWIFVVLMLATFTANLAAFLTVERMQSPIRNLEHLAAQSSVKYSVASNSTALNFFKNMANAEEILYQMWRNLTLTAPSSAKEYIVWEYPIREMYIHILSVINKTGVVAEDSDKGFQQVMDDEYFAFIHDAAQTKYHVYQNCNLTIIGEPFAEAPYAIAVAQGNPLQDNISMAILQLQTARYFEQLSTEFWSSKCPNLGDEESDGISLESLGGVFIATIIGLGIAFISLAIEVFTTARNRRKAKIEADNMIKPNFVGPLDFYGASKKSEVFRRGHGFLPEVIN